MKIHLKIHKISNGYSHQYMSQKMDNDDQMLKHIYRTIDNVFGEKIVEDHNICISDIEAYYYFDTQIH